MGTRARQASCCRFGAAVKGYKTAKKPCKRCGDTRRYFSGSCPTCKAASSKAWSNSNPMRRRRSSRLANARRGGYKPPPSEADCPPRPRDKRCQLCGRITADRRRGPSRTMTPGLDLDHCHDTAGSAAGFATAATGRSGKSKNMLGSPASKIICLVVRPRWRSTTNLTDQHLKRSGRVSSGGDKA